MLSELEICHAFEKMGNVCASEEAGAPVGKVAGPKMKALAWHAYGEPDAVLAVQDVAKPTDVFKGCVLLKVREHYAVCRPSQTYPLV